MPIRRSGTIKCPFGDEARCSAAIVAQAGGSQRRQGFVNMPAFSSMHPPAILVEAIPRPRSACDLVAASTVDPRRLGSRSRAQNSRMAPDALGAFQ